MEHYPIVDTIPTTLAIDPKVPPTPDEGQFIVTPTKAELTSCDPGEFLDGPPKKDGKMRRNKFHPKTVVEFAEHEVQTVPMSEFIFTAEKETMTKQKKVKDAMTSPSKAQPKRAIYLDYNATTPLHPEVKKAITDALDLWANPSSNSNEAKIAIYEARTHIAKLVTADPSDVVFVSGGTEANNWTIHTAIQLYHLAGRRGVPHIITTNVEHPATENALAYYEKASVTRISVHPSSGYVDYTKVMAAITTNTCLVTLLLANNETGVIQPIQHIADRVRAVRSDIAIHTDAAQAVGKIDLRRALRDVDYISIVGHKFYGPRIGALICRGLSKPSGNRLRPMFFGGSQEEGLRPGTENTPMIIGLGMAAKLVNESIEALFLRLQTKRDYLEKKLHDSAIGCRVACTSSTRLPNTCNVAFPSLKCSSTALLAKCYKFVASTGAACHSGQTTSQILLNHGISSSLASRSFRLSVGRETTEEEIDTAIEELLDMVEAFSN